MNLLGRTHGKLVHGRRVSRLSQQLSSLIPENAEILDVGCGDGKLAALIKELRPDVTIQGIDVMVRENTMIPVAKFDGSVIPFPDKFFDGVMFVDVLHHTNDPIVLLREASRVAKGFIAIKDHTTWGTFSDLTLRFMDWVGNKPHGVVLPYNYWKESQWKQAFQDLKLEILTWQKDLKLYPFLADQFFGRDLHMITKLGVN